MVLGLLILAAKMVASAQELKQQVTHCGGAVIIQRD
jgi:hypothetical protein